MPKAVPEGFTTVTPFLNITGCAEAIEFYKKAFGAEVHRRMPAPDGRIMHCEMRIGNAAVMLADAIRNAPTQSSIHLYVENCDEWWKRATEAGCKVEMPMADMFWGDRYGVLSDKWGNRWAIATHKEDVTDAEAQRRGDEMMKNMK